jgi:hypothetical protein
MSCLHIQYDGGDYNCYRCDLCEKRWDWGDAHSLQSRSLTSRIS